MNTPDPQRTPPPWSSIIRVALILGCTLTFCVLGLLAGVLASKAGGADPNFRGDGILMTILIPPAIGAIFGLVVGLISCLFVSWPNRKPLPPVAPPPVDRSK